MYTKGSKDFVIANCLGFLGVINITGINLLHDETRHMHHIVHRDDAGLGIKLCEGSVVVLDQHLDVGNFILGYFWCHQIVCNLKTD